MAALSDQTSVVPFSQPPHKRTETDSYLPEDVIELVLSFLSVKELCSLSVLSKRFKNSWKFCRDLSFDSNFARSFSRDEYRSCVNNFLHNNLNSCADRFKLYYDATGESGLVSGWIHRAVLLGVKEIELDLSPSIERFILCYGLVGVDSIRILKLVNCDLHLPLNSNGLRHLREITLQKVRALPVTVEAVFTNCASLRAMNLIQCNSIYSLITSALHLKTLVVKSCSDVDSIAINAPNLHTLHYHGKITEFNFYCNPPHLSDVIIDITHPRSFQILANRREMVDALAYVETLTVSSTVIEGLAARFKDNEYKDLEFSLGKLKELHLIVEPQSFLNPSDIVIFLRKCPCIERFFLDLGPYAFGDNYFWDNYGKSYLSECQIVFPFLKYVKIKGFTLKELPLSMARYILKNAIRLKCLVLVNARIHHLPEYYTPERLCWGILSNAQIEIYGYRKDKSTIMPKHVKRSV